MFEEPIVYGLSLFKEARDFIQLISEPTQSKVISSFRAIQSNNFKNIHVKSLRGKIKELIVKRFRFIFFIEFGTIYVIRGFIKKSNKTPIGEIEYAEKRYRELLAINQIKPWP